MSSSVLPLLLVTVLRAGAVPAFLDTASFILDTVPNAWAFRTRQDAGVAFNGQCFLWVWRQNDSTNTPCVYGARVSAAGELLDSVPILVGRSPSSTPIPRVASDGSGFLVVWQDYSLKVRGARVTSDGVVLDPNGIRICSRDVPRADPSVAFLDGNYLVTWVSSGSAPSWSDVWAARVLPSGSVLDTCPIRVSLHSVLYQQKRSPVAAAGSTSFLVAWQSDGTGEWQPYCARLDTAGRVLDSTPVLVGVEGSEGTRPCVASRGTDYIIAWQGGFDSTTSVYFRRFSGDGRLLDPRPVLLCSTQGSRGNVGAGFSGGRYFVVWDDARGGNPDIYGARVAPDGTIIDPGGRALVTAEQRQVGPVPAACDTGWFVVWTDARGGETRLHARAALVDTALSVVREHVSGPESTASYASQVAPAVAGDSTGFLAVWEDHRTANDQWDVYGMRVDSAGRRLDPLSFPISVAAQAQAAPGVCLGDSTYFVVWEDKRYGNWDIFGSRVARDGRVLDPIGIPILRIDRDQRGPAVAFDGTNFLVACANDGQLTGVFIDQAGRRIDSAGMRLCQEAGVCPRVAVCWGDTFYIVLYEASTDNKVHAVFVDRYGRRPDTTVAVVSGPSAYRPAATFDGLRFCAVWHEPAVHNIRARRYSRLGQALESYGVRIRSAAVPTSWPAAAFVGSGYLFAWNDNGALSQDVFGARTNTALSAVDTFVLSSQPGNEYQPGLVRGPGQSAFVVHACTTTEVNGRRASALRIRGRFFTDSFPLAPDLLWPPYNHRFLEPPVWILADTAVQGVDSFDFRVLRQVVDTLWASVTSQPRCTVPDTLFEPSDAYSAVLRARSGGRWSPFSLARAFGAGPPAPRPLWPWNYYVFSVPPVWFLVDTTLRPMDTFNFKVVDRFNETIFDCRVSPPCCTVPDSLFERQSTYRWKCRAHGWLGWGDYSPDFRFYIDYGPGVAESAEVMGGGSTLATLLRRAAGRVELARAAVEERWTGRVLDVQGRVVAALETRAGLVAWDFRGAGGRRVSEGVYYVVLSSDSAVLERKFVLVE